MKQARRKGRLMAFLMAVMMVITFAPAQADWLSELLTGYGLSGDDVQAFSSLLSEMGNGMSETEVQALLQEFLGDGQAKKIAGTLEGDRYTSPQGFAFVVPSGWNLLENQVGVATVLAGEADATGFMPTIAVVVLEEERKDFDTLRQEDWDTQLGTVLANYLFVALDDFPYLDVTAHEFVCMHGEREDAMLMQYQLYFNKAGKAYQITMTTLAEEAAHDNALNAYDSFLAEFMVSDTQG
ncbi:MAG: hypothetical protein FWF69_03985 [Firmicutes bacterium]|nr:hypothetical protein [Bacillota bacterium]